MIIFFISCSINTRIKLFSQEQVYLHHPHFFKTPYVTQTSGFCEDCRFPERIVRNQKSHRLDRSELEHYYIGAGECFLRRKHFPLGTGCAVACESNKEFTSVVAWFFKFKDEFENKSLIRFFAYYRRL